MFEAFIIIIVISAFIGFVISVYMTLGYYQIEPFFSWLGVMMPPVCRLNDSKCVTLLQHPSAHVLWLPNAVYGSLYYLLVLITAGTHNWILLWVVRWAAVLTLLLSAYLTFMLTMRIRQTCILCYTGHFINVLLAILLWNLPII